MAEINNDTWRRTSESLPEEALSVFIYNQFWDDPTVRLGFVDAGKWFFDENECLPCNPAPFKWRPWPEPPEAAEERHQMSEVREQRTETTYAIAPRTGA